MGNIKINNNNNQETRKERTTSTHERRGHCCVCACVCLQKRTNARTNTAWLHKTGKPGVQTKGGRAQAGRQAGRPTGRRTKTHTAPVARFRLSSFFRCTRPLQERSTNLEPPFLSLGGAHPVWLSLIFKSEVHRPFKNTAQTPPGGPTRDFFLEQTRPNAWASRSWPSLRPR